MTKLTQQEIEQERAKFIRYCKKRRYLMDFQLHPIGDFKDDDLNVLFSFWLARAELEKTGKK